MFKEDKIKRNISETCKICKDNCYIEVVERLKATYLIPTKWMKYPLEQNLVHVDAVNALFKKRFKKNEENKKLLESEKSKDGVGKSKPINQSINNEIESKNVDAINTISMKKNLMKQMKNCSKLKDKN